MFFPSQPRPFGHRLSACLRNDTFAKWLFWCKLSLLRCLSADGLWSLKSQLKCFLGQRSLSLCSLCVAISLVCHLTDSLFMLNMTAWEGIFSRLLQTLSRVPDNFPSLEWSESDFLSGLPGRRSSVNSRSLTWTLAVTQSVCVCVYVHYVLGIFIEVWLGRHSAGTGCPVSRGSQLVRLYFYFFPSFCSLFCKPFL